MSRCSATSCISFRMNSAGSSNSDMDNDAFRGFYGRTSPMLAAFLARSIRDFSTVDDLVQESYYRLLRAPVAFDGEEHRRRYLFRIAGNLLRDRHRRKREETQFPESGCGEPIAAGDLARQIQERADVGRAMLQLTSRERELVRMAYGQGSTHHEIAGALGLQPGSVKPLLFRAR